MYQDSLRRFESDDIRAVFHFDERLEHLAHLIGAIERVGGYCTHEHLFEPMPRLEAGTTGVLSFPVPPAQTQALLAEATQAPYGKGTETLVDRSVRDCRQLPTDRVHVSGRTWPTTFDKIMRQVERGLGCPENALTAELYKLLIYETGGFFAPHRDTEKADGMVATLVIALPVAGSGGELIIRHREKETVVDMRAEEASELVYAAFYADCEHEIRPVTSGHRICLVYNLIMQGTDSISTEPPSYEAEIDRLAIELRARCRDPETSGKLVWMLEHDYSEAGLSFATLKNFDAIVGKTLTDAAERADCKLHAALLHAEETDYVVGHDPVRRIDDVSNEDFDFVEVSRDRCWLDAWVHADGALDDYGNLPLAYGELMPPDALRHVRPDSQSLTEATGNEGASVNRIYRRAALVVWPRTDSVKVLAHGGTGPLATFLAARRAALPADAPMSDELKGMVSQVADAWPAPRPRWRAGRRRWHRDAAIALEFLNAAGDRQTVEHFLHSKVLPHYSKSLNRALASTAEKVEPAAMRNFLLKLVRRYLSRQTSGILDLARRLSGQTCSDANAADLKTMREFVTAICATMPAIGRFASDDRLTRSYYALSGRDPKPLSVSDLRAFIRLVWQFDLEHEAARGVECLTERPDLVSPDRTVPKLLERLHAKHAAATRASANLAVLWRHGAEFLLARSSLPPEPPTDWHIATDGLICHCQHCNELRAFCEDPQAQVRRFRAPRQDRSHLKTEITHGNVDIACVTEKHGRPYTLVCTKTRKSFENRMEEYAADIAAMRHLEACASAIAETGETPEQLRTAIAHAS